MNLAEKGIKSVNSIRLVPKDDRKFHTAAFSHFPVMRHSKICFMMNQSGQLVPNYEIGSFIIRMAESVTDELSGKMRPITVVSFYLYAV
jgi:hypothetical protein